MTSDGLGQLWVQLAGRLGQVGVPVFPALPLADCAPVVYWPGADWGAFLDFAARVGAPIIYTQSYQVTEHQIEALTAAADALEAEATVPQEDVDQDDAEGYDDEVDEPDALIDAEVRVREWRAAARAGLPGMIGRVELGFVVGGVLHQWTDEADEYAELIAAVDEAGRHHRSAARAHCQAGGCYGEGV